MAKGFTPRTKVKERRSPAPQPQISAKEWEPKPGIPTDWWKSKKRHLWIQLAYIDEHGEEQVVNRKVFCSVYQAEAIARFNAMNLGVARNPEESKDWTLQHVLVLDGTMPADMLSFPPPVAKYAEFYNPLNWIPPDIGEGGRSQVKLHLPAALGQESLEAIASSIPKHKSFSVHIHKE